MLESRHLVGLFLLLVVIFGVVFTLGYLLGRSQYESSLHAAVGRPPAVNSPSSALASKSKDEPDSSETLPPEKKSDWDFYHSAEPKKTEDHLQPPPKAMAAAKPSAAAKPEASRANPSSLAKGSAAANAPLIPRGAIMLQIAAVQSEGDALALAQALQQKKFPAFVITPSVDKYYRVQVGPFSDSQSASIARHNLEANGFKSIIKR